MDKLSSYNELKLPQGLFPKIESFAIEKNAQLAIARLNDISLDEVNEYLTIFDEMFGDMVDAYHSPEIQDQVEIIKAYYNNQIAPSYDDIPGKHVDSNQALLLGSMAKLRGAEDDSAKSVLAIFKNLASEVKSYKHLLSIATIKAYRDGVKFAESLANDPGAIDDPYYRLGRSAKYFYISEMISMSSSVLSVEINAIERQRDNVSGKGGKNTFLLSGLWYKL